MENERWTDEDLRQQHGFLFEACKHLTTLNTAAALVALARHRDADLWPLPFFGVSLATSAYGMLVLALMGTGEKGLSRATGGLVIGAITFVGGLYSAFAGAFSL